MYGGAQEIMGGAGRSPLIVAKTCNPYQYF